MVVGERPPGVAVRGVVLAHRAPGALAEVGAPLVPGVGGEQVGPRRGRSPRPAARAPRWVAPVGSRPFVPLHAPTGRWRASSGAGDACSGAPGPDFGPCVVTPDGEAPPWTPAAQDRPSDPIGRMAAPGVRGWSRCCWPVVAVTGATCPHRPAPTCRRSRCRSPPARRAPRRRRPRPPRRSRRRRPRAGRAHADRDTEPTPTAQADPHPRPTKSVVVTATVTPTTSVTETATATETPTPTTPTPTTSAAPAATDAGGQWAPRVAVVAARRPAGRPGGLPDPPRPSACGLGRRGRRGRDRGGVVRPRAAAAAAADHHPRRARGRLAGQRRPGRAPSRTGLTGLEASAPDEQRAARATELRDAVRTSRTDIESLVANRDQAATPIALAAAVTRLLEAVNPAPPPTTP